MRDHLEFLITLLFVLIVVIILLSPQMLYAIAKGQPDCAFARDVITCIKIGEK